MNTETIYRDKHILLENDFYPGKNFARANLKK